MSLLSWRSGSSKTAASANNDRWMMARRRRCWGVRDHDNASSEGRKRGENFKSELCNKFTETGSCPYGEKCKFAHGKAELRQSKRSLDKRYKTSKCRNFWKNGTCPYGRRCQFIHDETPEQIAEMKGILKPGDAHVTKGILKPGDAHVTTASALTVTQKKNSDNAAMVETKRPEHVQLCGVGHLPVKLARSESFEAILSDFANDNECVATDDLDKVLMHTPLYRPNNARLSVFQGVCEGSYSPVDVTRRKRCVLPMKICISPILVRSREP